MTHAQMALPDDAIPRAADRMFQHVLDTYASEVNKLLSTWRHFRDSDLSFRPHLKSSTVLDILKHELLSQRRFFAEFLGLPEPAAAEVLPPDANVEAFAYRAAEFAQKRLQWLARQKTAWWLEEVPFFDVRRERIWIVWRRILHTAHHRTQLTVYLRLLNRPVPAVYGPSADEFRSDADPTQSVAAAERR